MKKLKLLLLGGTSILIPVIKKAHELGIYVITCDYIPNNVAHKYSDEYHNISVVDQEAVLLLAKTLNIDGIMSFGCDAGAISVAYVQNKLGLPCIGPYESVCILQNKNKFRQFLKDNNFNTPKFWHFTSLDEIDKAKEELIRYFPLIVKPTDSNGSKGVSKITREGSLFEAVQNAFNYSRSGNVIIEQFIEQEGFSSDSDCFSVKGKLVYTSFSDQRFDQNAANTFAPAAYSWPGSMNENVKEELTSELQRLLKLLNMGTTIYNVESRVGKDGKAYLMEVSPRGGGNNIAEMIRLSTGIDLIANNIRASVGLPLLGFIENKDKFDNWAEVILHSNIEGHFKNLILKKNQEYIFEKSIDVKENELVNKFRAGNESIGFIIFNFRNSPQKLDTLNSASEWIEIIVS